MLSVGRCGVTGNGVIARHWAQGFRDDLVPRPDPQSPLGLVRLDPALPGRESDHDRAGQSFRERERAPVALS
jgi:hypothetical protein